MPPRKVILAIGETYHIFNRSLRQMPLFTNKREFDLFLAATKYYIQQNPPVKFSFYRHQPKKYKIDLSKTLIKIIAYCLMPDHFHFILTQLEKEGIKTFVHRLATSYSHYFNLKYNQKGPVFESKFKAVRVESQEQLIHLSRYIHLNPVTNFLVEDPIEYNYSSYGFYLHGGNFDLIDCSDVMASFHSPESYKKFVLDQKDYQRELKRIKHLAFDCI